MTGVHQPHPALKPCSFVTLAWAFGLSTPSQGWFPYKILAEIARLCSNRVSKNQIKQPDNENELSPPSASRDCYSVLFLIFAGMGADRTHGQRGVRVKYFER